MDETTKGGVMVFAAAAGFGTLAVFGKIAAAIDLSTTTLLQFRFLVGTALVWAVFGYRGDLRLLSGRSLRVALSLGILYSAMTGLFFWGLEYLSAGLAAILFFTNPLYVFVLSTVVLDERLTRRKLLALFGAGAGVKLIVGSGPTGPDLFGVGLVLLAAIGYATYTTGSRAILSSVDSTAFVATALFATTASMIPIGLSVGQLSIPTGLDQWLLVIGMGVIGTAVPIVLFVRGLERIEASHASVIGTSEPVVAVLLGVGLLGEPVTLTLVSGGLLVVCGALLVQLDSRSRERSRDDRSARPHV